MLLFPLVFSFPFCLAFQIDFSFFCCLRAVVLMSCDTQIEVIDILSDSDTETSNDPDSRSDFVKFLADFGCGIKTQDEGLHVSSSVSDAFLA